MIAYLPTGAGKTVVAVAIVKMALEKHRRVAFICNRNQLVNQTRAVFESYGIHHGVIQGENTHSTCLPVLVCSIQSIARRGLPDVDLIIIDECHACAGTLAYHDIMKDKIVVGLTATPYQKGLGRNIPSLAGPLFERVVVGAGMRELMDYGALVDADIYAPADPDLSGVKVVAGDYVEDQLGTAMDKAELVGDVVDQWIKLANGRQTMVFATVIPHSKHICEQFNANGISAMHVDYRMSDEEKANIYAAFRASKFKVLCNCALLSEGADFPACEVLSLVRPTKSKVRLVQMFGRVLRPAPGKTKALVLDHSGSIKNLGFPWDFSPQYLDDGKPKKRDGGDKKRPEPLPKECPHCKFLKPPRTAVCPACGFETVSKCDVECADGDLVPLTRGTKTKGLKALEEIGRTSVYHQLLWIARDRQYKDGWAAMKYKDAFGCWPNGIGKDPEDPCSSVLSWVRSQQIKWAKSHRRGAAA